MKLSYAQVVKRPALLERLTGLKVKEFESVQVCVPYVASKYVADC